MRKTLFFLRFLLDERDFFAYNEDMQVPMITHTPLLENGYIVFHESNSRYDPVENAEDKEFSHAHKHYELFQLLDGNISWIIDGKFYRLEPGDVILIRPNDFHLLKIHSENYTRRVLEFLPQCLNMTKNAYEWLLAPFDVEAHSFSNLLPKALLKTSNFNALYDKLQSVLTNPQALDVTRSLTAGIYLAELLLCVQSLHKENVAVKTYTPPICQTVIGYVNAHIQEKILLDDLERKLHLSRFHISHEFKRHMGIGLSRYVIEKKILYAEQLIESGVSPTEAAYAVGYDYPNFYMNYKKVLHKTPKQSIPKK